MRRSERSNAGRLGGGEGAPATPSMFQFKMVDRLQCMQSNTVKYMSQAAENVLSLQVKLLGIFVVCMCRCIISNVGRSDDVQLSQFEQSDPFLSMFYRYFNRPRGV